MWLNVRMQIYMLGEGEDALGYKNMPSKTQFVKHGDIIQVGNVKLEVLHTPGHTPESISFLLTDLGGGSSVPNGVYLIKCTFVGDIGRPDLLEKSVQIKGSTEISAKRKECMSPFKILKIYQTMFKSGRVMVLEALVVKH